MIDKTLIDLLKMMHGTFNICVAFAFFYQASVGFKIRGQRLSDGKADISLIKKHRKLGPFLAALGPFGFFAGVFIVLIQYGQIMIFTSHFVVGLALSIFIVATYLISRMLKSRDSAWRTLHLIIGLVIMALYGVQIFLGITIIY